MNNRRFALFVVALLMFADSVEGLKVLFMASLLAGCLEVMYLAVRWLWTVRQEAGRPSPLAESESDSEASEQAAR